jgi:hypothetical protein
LDNALITVPEAAAILERSETIVRRLTKREELPIAKVQMRNNQRLVYYRRGDVEAYKRRRDGTDAED